MDDYESDNSDGQQPDMIAVPRAEWERVQAQLAAARAALKAVEWVAYDEYRMICPWCKELRGELEIHAPDCQRQAALAAMEEKE